MKKLLIVNDRHDESAQLTEIFSGEYEIFSAADRQQAKSFIYSDKHGFAAVIIDAYLGDGDAAFSLLADIRGDNSFSETPLVISVDQNDTVTSAKAIECGADEGITKPYNPVIVRQRIKNVFDAFKTRASASKSYEELALINRLIEDSSSAVYVCDTQTYEMLYLNQNCAKICGRTVSEAKGQTCFGFLKRRSSPCEKCHMDCANDSEYTVQQYYSEASGKYYHARSRLIDWGGRSAMVEYLVDDTERINAHKRLQEMVDRIPSGIGLFKLSADNRLELTYLNDGYYAMLGTSREERAVYQGDSFAGAIFPEDVPVIEQAVRSLRRDGRSSNVDLRVKNGAGGYTWVSISCTIDRNHNGDCVVFASYSNIDSAKKNLLQLDATKRVLEMANHDGKISLWLYNMDTKRITRDFLRDSALGLPEVMENVPESMMDSEMIFPDDRQALVDAYQVILDGGEKSECYVRLLNMYTRMYSWQHVTVTRFEDSYYSDRMAFGTTTDVNEEYETRLKFEREENLRKQLFENALVYYELNLSKGTFEEYVARDGIYRDVPVNNPINEKTRGELLALIHEDDRDRVFNSIFFDALLKKYEQGELNGECVYRQAMPNGAYHWVKSVVTIIKHPDTGEVIAFIFVNDIDREANEKAALGCIIDEEIDSAYIINTMDNTIRSIRDHIHLQDDITDEDFPYDFVAAQAVTFVLDEDRESCRRFLELENLVREIRKNGRATTAFRVELKNGAVMRKSVSAFFLNAEQANIVMTMRDITALYEEELQQKKLLQDALDAANEASAAKSDFLARMSHDMRTPLNAVIGMTSIAQKETNSEKTDMCLAEIDNSSHFLLALINDILDFGRIERGQLELHMEPYTLDEFKKSLDTVIRPLMEKNRLNFVTRFNCGEEGIITDKMRFCQIFFNLLLNSAKFTAPGGTVELETEAISPNKQGKAGMRFFVRDNGKGMSQQFMSKMYQPFTQENRVDCAGTGLGLAIVHRLVEAFGGNINVRSAPKQGTEFIVDLYVDKTAPEPDDKERDKADYSALAGKRILLVDDNAINLLVAKTLLESVGCVVETAVNGMQSVNEFASSKPDYYDAVLMDMRMPVMDGLTATREIRALNRPDAGIVPIIALTANAFAQDRQAAENAGMNSFLTKPIDPDLMYRALMEQL